MDQIRILEQGSGVVLPELCSFAGQPYRFMPGAREVEMYIREPHLSKINENTGLMLVSHNWGGTWQLTAPWCDNLADKFNLICISVNYLQSGVVDHKDAPYDHGLLQSLDCLRALYYVREMLKEKNVTINTRRCYAAGASGGGNVSQMVNKLAPHTFGCIIDLCGMPGLTDDIAFGRGQLNAGYSPDPKHPFYLTPAMQEIRDFGNPAHLALQYKANPKNKVVIVHGQEDTYCNCLDKIGIFRNMVAAGFLPDACFITPGMVDGVILTTTGHAVGDRPIIIGYYGKPYIQERGEHVKVLQEPDDFERKHVVKYPVTGGTYEIDFSCGVPEIRFVQQ